MATMESVQDQQRAGCYRDPDTGFLMMPGTRRPDGTWRKPRRVKEGYVPQEEVPLYESKGKAWAKSRETSSVIPGLSSGILNMKIDTFDSRKLQPAAHIPGLSPDVKVADDSARSSSKSSKKKSKNKSQQAVNSTPQVNSTSWEPPSAENDSTALASASVQVDPAKKLRNLRKKLRDIEALEQKLAEGSIAKPEPEQLEKVARKRQVEEEIATLEKTVQS